MHRIVALTCSPRKGVYLFKYFLSGCKAAVDMEANRSARMSMFVFNDL